MKIFEEMQIREAFDYAAQGGQALHLFESAGLHPNAPACFRRARIAAHLIDNDIVRLSLTASELGVKKIVVSRVGRQGQHVDLCGRPLQKALCIARSSAANGVPEYD